MPDGTSNSMLLVGLAPIIFGLGLYSKLNPWVVKYEEVRKRISLLKQTLFSESGNRLGYLFSQAQMRTLEENVLEEEEIYRFISFHSRMQRGLDGANKAACQIKSYNNAVFTSIVVAVILMIVSVVGISNLRLIFDYLVLAYISIAVVQLYCVARIRYYSHLIDEYEDSFSEI